MPFSSVLGQETAVGTLTRALAAGRVHHAYRFEGPDGVGKEMAAMALAQALVCEGDEPLGCGRCDACARAVTLAPDDPRLPQHPDVILVERGLYPPETIGRSRPELNELSVDQIRRVVLSHAAFPPHQNRARVFIVRRADELSISAANALLKTLEEPRSDTFFVLLTSRPARLLDTVRSRTLPLRFGPLPEDVLRGILVERGVPDERIASSIELAAGSASLALSLADPEATAVRDAFVDAVLGAVRTPGLGAAVALAESRQNDRGELRADLGALGAALARSSRESVTGDAAAALSAARCHGAVLKALGSVDKNASASLVLMSMIVEMKST